MRIRRRALESPQLLALVGIVALGAALRFATIDGQSYRYDEAVTVGRILHPGLFDTLSASVHGESTPPLYYLLAWLWTRPFGSGEIGLRAFSALAGTASIAVVYLGAVSLPLPRRAGLFAAAIVAVNPVLVWFSQDARAYALAFLLTALSFLFFARARRGGGGSDLAWWAVCSAPALAAHYFTAFVVAPEAALLLWGSTDRRRVAVAVAALGAAGLLLLPVALHQRGSAHAAWIAEQPLSQRLERAGAKLVGEDNGNEHGRREPGPVPVVVPAALALAALALLLWGGDEEERRGGRIAALVGGAGLALALLLAALGADYIDGRNLIPLFAPLTILLGAGFAVRRAAPVATVLGVAFCLCALVFTLEIDRLPRLQREDLRNAAARVGPLRAGKVVVAPRYSASQPLRYYLGARPATAPLPRLLEIDLVGSAAAARANAARLLPPGFRRAGAEAVSYDFTLTRYRATHPVRVPLKTLEAGALVGGGARAAVLVAGR